MRHARRGTTPGLARKPDFPTSDRAQSCTVPPPARQGNTFSLGGSVQRRSFFGDTEVRRRRSREVSYPGAKRSEARFSSVVTALGLPLAEALDSEPCGGAIVSRGQRPDRCRKGRKRRLLASGEEDARNQPAGTFWPKRLISPRFSFSEESRFGVLSSPCFPKQRRHACASDKQESLPITDFTRL